MTIIRRTIVILVGSLGAHAWTKCPRCSRSFKSTILLESSQTAAVVGVLQHRRFSCSDRFHSFRLDASLRGTAVDATTEQENLQEQALSLQAQNDTNRLDWMGRVRQLHEYKAQHGHTVVPKRYAVNPALGKWVMRQRQLYRRYLAGTKPCSLTPERIDILNSIGFCWDATNVTKLHHQNHNNKDDELEWWNRLKELRQLADSNKNSSVADLSVSFRSALHAWIKKQRKNYRQLDNDFPQNKLKALNDIDPDWWMTKRELQWERRFRELQDYRAKHGDCCVPISYHSNKKLANWVSNQRKQYKRRQQGKTSDMTQERQDRLCAAGFVWDRWEYEYEMKW